jgi:putative endopeptidase
VALEAKIASNQWTFGRLRDRKANYHPMSVQELTRYAPGFPWRAFLDARSVGIVSDVVLGTDTAVKVQAQLFANTPLDDWRSYIAFHWIQNQIDVLPRAFRESSWAFVRTPPIRQRLSRATVKDRDAMLCIASAQ